MALASQALRPACLMRQQVHGRIAKRNLVLATRPSASSSTVVTVSEGQIFGRGAQGAWDAAAVGNPVVRCYVGDNEDRWFMWYSGHHEAIPSHTSILPAAGSIGVAVSTDGINWQRGDGLIEGARGADKEEDVGAVLRPNPDWWTCDTAGLAVSDVQVLSTSSVSSGVGVYWMFYSGADYEPVAVPPGMPGLAEGAAVEGLRARPALAMSQDGRNWARIEGDHHSGAVLDVGSEGEWDSIFIGHPQVLAAGPRDMRMYYHSYCPQRQRFVIGWAASPDGFRWSKKGVIFEGGSRPGDFDERGAAACHVVRDVDNKQYRMFYEGIAADGTRSIGMAVSKDGRSWQRCPEPVLQPNPEPGAWDAGGVGAPSAVSMSAGRWRLYYAGRSDTQGPWEGIGLALSAAESGNGAAAVQGLKFRRRAGGDSSSVSSSSSTDA